MTGVLAPNDFPKSGASGQGKSQAGPEEIAVDEKGRLYFGTRSRNNIAAALQRRHRNV